MLFKAWIHLTNDLGELDVSVIFPSENIFQALECGKKYATQLKGQLKTVDNITTYEVQLNKQNGKRQVDKNVLSYRRHSR
jgi:hypothetical protein